MSTNDFVIPSWPVPSLPVADGGRFPVRRIFCVGRNYAAHAREMGADPTREPPFFFSKPAYSLVDSDGAVPYPPATANLHHELELVVALSRAGRDIAVSDAREYIYGYAVGLDMTRRDLQNAAKSKGHPWDMAKGFDHSAPCSAIVAAARIGHPTRGELRLTVNGAERQRADLADMIWDVPSLVAELSRLVEIAPGDLVYTGTPEGVAAVVRGDVLEGTIAGVGDLRVTIT
jgi:fumarylpyruvate hydrolase